MAADDLVSGKYGLKAVGIGVEALRWSGSTVVVVVVDGRRKRCKRGFASLQTVEDLLLPLLAACVDELMRLRMYCMWPSQQNSLTPVVCCPYKARLLFVCACVGVWSVHACLSRRVLLQICGCVCACYLLMAALYQHDLSGYFDSM